MRRARAAAAAADLCLWVLDAAADPVWPDSAAGPVRHEAIGRYREPAHVVRGVVADGIGNPHGIARQAPARHIQPPRPQRPLPHEDNPVRLEIGTGGFRRRQPFRLSAIV